MLRFAMLRFPVVNAALPGLGPSGVLIGPWQSLPAQLGMNQQQDGPWSKKKHP
jgi:hypothetical protein